MPILIHKGMAFVDVLDLAETPLREKTLKRIRSQMYHIYSILTVSAHQYHIGVATM